MIHAGGLARPSATDSYVTEHDGVTYVVLRDQRRIVAVYVYDTTDGDYKALDTWPREIEK